MAERNGFWWDRWKAAASIGGLVFILAGWLMGVGSSQAILNGHTQELGNVKLWIQAHEAWSRTAYGDFLAMTAKHAQQLEEVNRRLGTLEDFLKRKL